MTGLERETMDLLCSFRKSHNNNLPKYADCLIRFKEDGGVKDTVISLSLEDKSDLDYRVDGVNGLISTLADIDELDNRFDQEEDAYQVGTAEYVILEVEQFF